MIRVTIEMDPGGLGEGEYVMHVIEISNDVMTSLVNPRKGSYRYRISRKLVEGQKLSWSKEGKIHNFPRASKNSVRLLLAVLKDAYEGENDARKTMRKVPADRKRRVRRRTNR